MHIPVIQFVPSAFEFLLSVLLPSSWALVRPWLSQLFFTGQKLPQLYFCTRHVTLRPLDLCVLSTLEELECVSRQ